MFPLEIKSAFSYECRNVLDDYIDGKCSEQDFFDMVSEMIDKVIIECTFPETFIYSMRKSVEMKSRNQCILIADALTVNKKHSEVFLREAINEAKSREEMIRVIRCLCFSSNYFDLFCYQHKDSAEAEKYPWFHDTPYNRINDLLSDAMLKLMDDYYKNVHEDRLWDVEAFMLRMDIIYEEEQHREKMSVLHEMLWSTQHPEFYRERVNAQISAADRKRAREEMRKKQRQAEAEERALAEIARHEQAEKERIEIFEKHEAHRLESAKERSLILKQFETLSVVEKLKIITSDVKHHPGYYGLDFRTITEEEIGILPKELVLIVLNAHKKYKGNGWPELKRRIQKCRLS